MHRRAALVHGGTAGLFEYEFTTGAHRPYFVTKPVARRLERQLDCPNWTDADIAAPPVTHIGEWARANGVELDRLYAGEEREGGTPALGAGAPALSRRQLSVFTPERWERRKNRLIYEAWLEAAREQLEPGAN
jgi:hypothetical protein